MNSKIDAVQKKLSRNLEQAEALKAELLKLHREKEAIMSREIFEAFKKSGKSYSELMTFLGR